MRTELWSVEKLRSVTIAITLALLGVAGAIYATRWGVGLIADSKYYLAAAQSLIEGHGLVVPTATSGPEPMTNWPPLFSILLAGLGLLGIDPQVGARWLNIGLFGATILVGTFTIRHVTGGSTRLALFGGFLMATSVDLLSVHTLAGTEPLFIFFGLLGLVLVGAHLERPEPRFLLGAAAAIALAFLSRYIGVTLVATGALAVLFFGRRDRQARLKNATVLAVVSSLPMLFWMLRNWLSAHQPIGSFRVLGFHPPTREKVRVGLNTLWGWVSPMDGLSRFVGHLPWIRWVLILSAVAAVVVGIRRWRTWRDRSNGETAAEPLLVLPLFRVLLTFIVLYLGFLLVTMSLLDPTIPFDQRLLSPIFPAVLILAIGAARRLLGAFQGSQPVRWAVTLGCLLLAALYADAATRWVLHGHENGLGYAGRYWRESDILRMVAAAPPGVLIYTNGADVVTLVTGRLADDLPRRVLHSGQRNPNYGSDIATMGELLKHGAVLVYLNRITWRWYYPSEAELKEQLPLRLRERAPDGAIYDIAP